MRDTKGDAGGLSEEDVNAREELGLLVLRAFVHDLASPLAVMTSNLPVARALPVVEADEGTELNEILEDLELATSRMRELTNDMRLYAGASNQDLDASAVLATALRLLHGHLSRRVTVRVALEGGRRFAASPSLALRALSDAIVAMTRELPTGRAHALEIGSDGDGVVFTITPPPAQVMESSLQAAAARLAAKAELESGEQALRIRFPARWAPGP